MKKTKPTVRDAAGKHSTVKHKESGKTKTVEAYVASVPKLARAPFRKLRATIRSAVPRSATEVISYGIPAIKDKRMLVWFAAFSNHCSLFPTNAVIEKFANELQAFSTTKGSVHFPLDKALPVALIKKMVKARVTADKARS